MGYYAVDIEYLNKFLEETIPKNSKFKSMKEDIINIVFLDVDVSSNLHKGYTNGYWSNESKDPSQLYLKDKKYHIRVKDLVLDFFKHIISGELLQAISELYSESQTEVNVFKAATCGIEVIVYIKHLLKDYIVKLDDKEYCIYLQLVTHFMEHKEFSIGDIKRWLPDQKCNMHTKWNCPYRINDKCEIADEQIFDIIQQMVKRNILSPVSNDKFKIRY